MNVTSGPGAASSDPVPTTIACTGSAIRATCLLTWCSREPTSGSAPLNVSFTAAGSTDPEAGALTYAWDLDGDGAFDDGTGASASWTYTSAGVVHARVLVTDAAGLSDVAGSCDPRESRQDRRHHRHAEQDDDVAGRRCRRRSAGARRTPTSPAGFRRRRLSWDVIIRALPVLTVTSTPCRASWHGIGCLHGAGPRVSVVPRAAPDGDDASGLQHTASANLHPATVPLTVTTNRWGSTGRERRRRRRAPSRERSSSDRGTRSAPLPSSSWAP